MPAVARHDPDHLNFPSVAISNVFNDTSTAGSAPDDRVPRSNSRVAYLISRYPAISHTFVLEEIRGLRQLGIPVQVISVLGPDRSPERMSAKERQEHESTFYVRPSGWMVALLAHLKVLLKRPLPYARGIYEAVRLSRWNLFTALRHLRFFSEALVVGLWMERQGIEHLHTHFASTVALFARSVFPIRMSATIHGSDEFKDGIGFLLHEKVRAADFIVAISFYGKGQLMRYSSHEDWPRLHVVRLGVNTSEFNTARSPAREGRPFEVICVGRLASPKAHLVLIEACAALLREGRDLQLSLVGDGPDRSYLENAARELGVQDRVIFHGSVRHDLVIDHYRRADLFALASFAEGVPVVLMEAMAMELPCVATAITGIPELIRDQVEGLLVPPADTDGLREAIRRLMDDPSLRLRMGKAGREKVLKMYDLDQNLEDLRRCFQGVRESDLIASHDT
ncbi:MAG: glycosyltransferase family 4 protein [Acidobacteriota bacterium]|nr:glycosyltransferase family 4 protein [Acidobacteriota bacterium]